MSIQAEQPPHQGTRPFPVHAAITADQPASTLAPGQSVQFSWVRTIVVLFKLRIVTLLLFAGVGGAALAAAALPAPSALGLLFFCGGFAAAGASALNQYWEQEQDAVMRRTMRRPLVVTAIAQPRWVFWVAVGMIGVPVFLVAPFNPALAVWSLIGAIIYVGVYTIWLKPRTVLNIVIGGLAGSCAVLSGGAAVGAWSDPGVLALALLIFLWTPTHFWSLAIVYRDDYDKAGIPMLPVRTTLHRATIWVLFHSVATGAVALGLAMHNALGLIYLIVATLATLHLLLRSYQLLVTPDVQQAKTLFMTSNLYLTLILVAICLDVVLGA